MHRLLEGCSNVLPACSIAWNMSIEAIGQGGRPAQAMTFCGTISHLLLIERRTDYDGYVEVYKSGKENPRRYEKCLFMPGSGQDSQGVFLSGHDA